MAGFMCYELNDETKVGEVQLLAVHPEYQNHGIGTQLNLFALQKLKENHFFSCEKLRFSQLKK